MNLRDLGHFARLSAGAVTTTIWKND